MLNLTLFPFLTSDEVKAACTPQPAQTSTLGAEIEQEETMSKQESDAAQKAAADDEPDDWDKRIFSTGCADENAKLTDCYFEKKDWRQCTAEVRPIP
ncbi:CHCH domain-containing protein, partial [Colletotrichum chrysophilum]